MNLRTAPPPLSRLERLALEIAEPGQSYFAVTISRIGPGSADGKKGSRKQGWLLGDS